MTNLWQPGTYYGPGSEVKYNGANYRIIQPHSSQGDWTPDVTPALWGRMQGGDSDCNNNNNSNNNNNNNSQNYQQQQPQQQQHNYGQSDYKPPQPSEQTGYGGKHPEQTVEVTHEEKKKNWFDLDDDRKKQIEIGGGLLAGAAAIGAGFFAYKHHEKNEEEKKAQAWGAQNWLADAQARSEAFKRNGPSGPATWVLTEGKNIPRDAILVGQEKSWNLYICRAFMDGGIQLGKASDAFKKGGVIGYGGEENHVGTYEILLGDMRGLVWVATHGKLNVASLGKRPVEGGRENDGTPLYVAKAPHKGAVHPGKASEKLDGAYIPYDGDEKCIKEYQVLCYN
ncbi:hypothetical protein EYR38_006801 [Pleurotus pulmonarius]|nr:hypothetical protein EYR38_006801 [Pleurotus pulmonarius]